MTAASSARRHPTFNISERDAILAREPWLSADDLANPQARKAHRTRDAGPDRAVAEPEGPMEIDEEASVHSDSVPFEPEDRADLEPPPLPPPLVDPHDELQLDEAEDDDDRDVWTLLADERRVWAWDNQEEMDFYTRITGGEWLERHRGTVICSTKVY